MWCYSPTGRKRIRREGGKETFLKDCDQSIVSDWQVLSLGFIWDYMGGKTVKVPKWVFSSWFWDSSITVMSYSFFKDVWICDSMTTREMKFGPRGLANFFTIQLFSVFGTILSVNCCLLTSKFQSEPSISSSKNQEEQIIPCSSI